jgi:hypothetical protein
VRAAISLATWIFGLGVLLVGAVVLFLRDAGWLAPAAILMVLFAMTWLVHAVEGARTCCAVCARPLFGTRKSQRHPAARSFLGSCGLRLSLEILRQGHYQCPRCNAEVTCEQHAAVRPVADGKPGGLEEFSPPGTAGRS